MAVADRILADHTANGVYCAAGIVHASTILSCCWVTADTFQGDTKTWLQKDIRMRIPGLEVQFKIYGA